MDVICVILLLPLHPFEVSTQEAVYLSNPKAISELKQSVVSHKSVVL